MSAQMTNTLAFEDVTARSENLYPFDTERDINTFFQEYPHLIDITSKSIAIIVGYFTDDRLYLKVSRDPRHDSSDRLSIVVKTALDAATVSQKLSDLDEDFSRSSIPNDILVHVEFQ